MNDINKVYDKIAFDFDKTRILIWPCVKHFLRLLPSNSLVADIGTGNGKNIRFRKDITMIANDISKNLLSLAKYKNININNSDFILANGINLPYRSNIFDYVISIAVLHHLPNNNNRIQFISELFRIINSKGKILITVWASEQIIKTKWIKIEDTISDYLIPWQMKDGNTEYRFYHLFSEKEIILLIESITKSYILTYEKDNWIINIDLS